MKLTVKTTGGVAPGTYMLKFIGMSDVPEDKERGYGAGVRWEYEVTSGPHKGCKCGRITSTKVSPKTNCGKFVVGTTGKPLTDGEFDPASYFGQTYIGVVTATASSATRVESVSLPPSA